MVRYEKGCSRICIAVFSLSISKVGTSKTFGNPSTIPIPEWKWEHITMDFVVGLPRAQGGYDTIWVIVDRLTKLAHFLAIRNNYSLNQLAELYVDEIVKLHGV